MYVFGRVAALRLVGGMALGASFLLVVLSCRQSVSCAKGESRK